MKQDNARCNPLAGQFVLVTGASGGLGRETVRILAANGCLVFACDLHPAEAGDNIFPILLDVTSDDSIAACLQSVQQQTQHLYALINLAGIFRMDTVSDGAEQALLDSVEVNFFGAYRMNRAFLPLLRQNGRIINMSSELAGYSPQPFNGCYCISKHALDAYTDTLARELAFVGIPVVKIRAGSFQTGLLSEAGTRFAEVAQTNTLLGPAVGVFSGLVSGELSKTNDPALFGALILKILKARKPKRRWRIKNSAKLRLLNLLPETWQDRIYLFVVRYFAQRTPSQKQPNNFKEPD